MNGLRVVALLSRANLELVSYNSKFKCNSIQFNSEERTRDMREMCVNVSVSVSVSVRHER